MVSLGQHFVPNPVAINSTASGTKRQAALLPVVRRAPLFFHTRYDALGRLDQVEEHWRFGTQLDADATADGYQPEVTDYVYDLSGNLAQTRFAGGVVTDYRYDGLNRLDMMRNYVDDGDHTYELNDDDLLSEFDYTVRTDGKRTGVVEKVYTGSATKTTNIDWLYDNLGRLVAEVYDADVSVDGDALDFIDRYEFDLVGNRLSKQRDEAATDAAISAFLSSGTFNPDLNVDYTYDANDRLQTEKSDAPGTADDRFTVYGYDATQTSKTVHVGLDVSGATVERTDYTYNLQGRMSKVEIDSDGNGDLESRIEYEYDDSGICVAQTVTEDSDNDGDLSDETPQRTDYHVDQHNPTGYAQVLEEMQGGAVVKSYTIGHDVFLEAVAANQVRHLLKDGHGSTRQLVDALGNVIQNGQTPQVFAYDAYGNPHGFTLAQALTSHLYSGERMDQLTGLQYLRARYYNPATGTFNRLDPFPGNFSDPQSLHKYLYVHGDPISHVDPSGLFPGFPWPRLFPGHPLPDDIQIPVMGTMVHSFLGTKFKDWATSRGLTAWADQENRTIVRRITGNNTFPREKPYSYKPDLASWAGATTLNIYEIKHADIILQAPFYTEASLFAAGQLSRKGFFPLSAMAPGMSVAFGRAFWPGYKTWPDFPFSPPGWQLITWNNYAMFPGVMLYDWVPTKLGVEITALAGVGTVAAAYAIQVRAALFTATQVGGIGAFIANRSNEARGLPATAPPAPLWTAASIAMIMTVGGLTGGTVRC